MTSHTNGQKVELISLMREHIDPNKIQGFVLASSEQLLVLQYVYDFHLDGLMILCKSDITEIKSTATDKFQQGLLKEEGLIDQIPFDTPFDIQGWRSIINQLAQAYPLIIIERERVEDSDLVIGQIVKTTATAVYVRYFTGVGCWLEKPVRVPYAEITSCQVDTNYLNVYRKHFKRTGP